MDDLTPQPGAPDEGVLIALQRRVVSLLSKHAVLLGSHEDWRRLNAAVDALDDDERHAWQELLTYLERTGRLFAHQVPPECLDDMATLTDIIAALPRGRHV